MSAKSKSFIGESSMTDDELDEILPCFNREEFKKLEELSIQYKSINETQARKLIEGLKISQIPHLEICFNDFPENLLNEYLITLKKNAYIDSSKIKVGELSFKDQAELSQYVINNKLEDKEHELAAEQDWVKDFAEVQKELSELAVDAKEQLTHLAQSATSGFNNAAAMVFSRFSSLNCLPDFGAMMGNPVLSHENRSPMTSPRK